MTNESPPVGSAEEFALEMCAAQENHVADGPLFRRRVKAIQARDAQHAETIATLTRERDEARKGLDAWMVSHREQRHRTADVMSKLEKAAELLRSEDTTTMVPEDETGEATWKMCVHCGCEVDTCDGSPTCYGARVRGFLSSLKETAPEAAPAYAEEPGRDYRKERDAAYTERNRLVAALARLFPSWLADHQDKPGENWDPEWRTVVFIDGPTGQLSWHLHDSDVPFFDGLPRGENNWDGHTTEEKYERVARIRAPSPPPGSEPATPGAPTEGMGET